MANTNQSTRDHGRRVQARGCPNDLRRTVLTSLPGTIRLSPANRDGPEIHRASMPKVNIVASLPRGSYANTIMAGRRFFMKRSLNGIGPWVLPYSLREAGAPLRGGGFGPEG